MLTPKERANDLCLNMLMQLEWNQEAKDLKTIAKKCALIAVDEIVSEICACADKDFITSRLTYWEEVKKEIQKLN